MSDRTDQAIPVGFGVAAVLVAFLLGIVAARWGFPQTAAQTDPDPMTGYWEPPPEPDEPEPEKSALTDEERENLLSLPYAAATRSAPAELGVTLHRRDRAQAGLNLYVSGHGTEANLIDMEGRVVHRWSVKFKQAFPDRRAFSRTIFWRRARLLDDGDILAIFEYTGIIRVDRDSRLLWSHAGGNHHDLDLDDRGRIFVIGRRNRINPQAWEREILADDVIEILAADGALLDELSVFDCFAASAYAPMLDRMASAGDAFHTNTVSVLDGSLVRISPHYRKGNLLISMREPDTLAIIDPEKRQVVWAMTGLWRKQHEPVLLETGSMLLFDNNTDHEHSRVLEFDPFSGETVWEYRGSEEQPFYSRIGGSAQRLSNGNTLIVESSAGRAFEVDPQGRSVWEFVSPHRAGEEDELIATLFDLVRVPADAAAWATSP